jgi:hypothetical protein
MNPMLGKREWVTMGGNTTTGEVGKVTGMVADACIMGKGMNHLVDGDVHGKVEYVHIQSLLIEKDLEC